MTWLVNLVASCLGWIADRFRITLDLEGLELADDDILSDLEHGRC